MTPGIAPLRPESRSEAEALIPLFNLDRILNQDQAGRRTTLLGKIHSQQGILVVERAAFPTSTESITDLICNLTSATNLGTNDIYRWYLASHNSNATPNLKINLIWPCTDAHIRKYTAQKLRYVTETPEVYAQHLVPYIERTQRTAKRLDWIYNILDGQSEQEDVVYNSPDDINNQGFMLLPDLNWDRRTVTGMHLLALVKRRDIWSLRGLRKSHVPWLKRMRADIVQAAARVGAALDTDEQVDPDQFKCYVHYQPTYYHFHVHVVHVMLEAEGGTQSVGKAFALENLISQLENMAGDQDTGLDQVDLSYFVGEESDVWKLCFARLKMGDRVTLNDE